MPCGRRRLFFETPPQPAKRVAAGNFAQYDQARFFFALQHQQGLIVVAESAPAKLKRRRAETELEAENVYLQEEISRRALLIGAGGPFVFLCHNLRVQPGCAGQFRSRFFLSSQIVKCGGQSEMEFGDTGIYFHGL